MEIFDWVHDQLIDDKCQGGVYWNIAKTYKNAVTNELFLELGINIYNTT